MSTILEKANQILNEKNTKLLPENLKAGITCLGVEGTFTSEVKKFNNMEELLADTDTNCLKIICKPTQIGNPVQLGDEIAPIYVANNFTVANPITEETVWTMTTALSVGSSKINFTLTLTPTTAELYYEANVLVSTVTGRWGYVSEDGIYYHPANENIPEKNYSEIHVDLMLISDTFGIVESFTGEINKLFASSIIDGYEFKGIYEYKNEAWQLITTQLTGTAREVLQGYTVYTNDGVVEGNHIAGIPAPVYVTENIDVTAIRLNTEITLSKPYSELEAEFKTEVGGGFNTSNRWINWRNEKSNMFCSTNIQESSIYVSIVPRVNNEYIGMMDFHYTSTDGQHYSLNVGEFQMMLEMWTEQGIVGNYCDINLDTFVIKFKEAQLLGIAGPNEDNSVTVDVPWTEDFAKPFIISEYVDIVTI